MDELKTMCCRGESAGEVFATQLGIPMSDIGYDENWALEVADGHPSTWSLQLLVIF